jgi:TonB family protein
MNKLCVISILPIVFFSNYTTAIELSKHLSTSTEPIPKVRVEPKYPMNAARAGREGWAQFSFIIEKDGSVSNVIPIDNSGSKDITLAAKKAILKWQYEPAMENAQPIQQCVNNVQLDFRMDGDGTIAVTKRFRNLFKKANIALEIKDYAKVDEYLAHLKKIKYLHMSENNYLQLLYAQYAKEINDEALQLSHLYKINFSENSKVKKQALSVLQQRFALEMKLNRLKQAYITFKAIEKNPDAKPYLENYQSLIKRIDKFINSDKEVVVSANIRGEDYWQHSLMRNEFTLTDIKGKLSKLDIRCANKRHVYSIENNNTWQLPESWKHCNIFVFGENNATFNLIEHPFKV